MEVQAVLVESLAARLAVQAIVILPKLVVEVVPLDTLAAAAALAEMLRYSLVLEVQADLLTWLPVSALLILKVVQDFLLQITVIQNTRAELVWVELPEQPQLMGQSEVMGG